ncbi:TetR/AcrR family transcriptional regulator [Ktedonosporobacter rubrisoli]|nr:TetR/AcrR family transcriptional regulator [Ktedonosporobacter rubrisoli]
MSVNQERRLARRQKRGQRRVEDILRTAGEIFVEQGYDHATTQMIAQRADVSAGSLYQFFPNKEAIAMAFVEQSVQRLQCLYDEHILVPKALELPLPRFIDHYIDALIAFNQNNPGYFSLMQSATLSPQLISAMQGQRQEISVRIMRVVQAFAPGSTPEQCEVLAVVSYRVFLALLPVILQADEQRKQIFIKELKTILFRYFAPLQER